MKTLHTIKLVAGSLQKYFLVAVMAVLLASCDAGEVTPDLEIEDMEINNTFVSNLAVNYYGEKINLYQRSLAILI